MDHKTYEDACQLGWSQNGKRGTLRERQQGADGLAFHSPLDRGH